jgi:UDP-N-acetylmuramoyl-tripeptide--D-alanyl-D-alanine ligase
MNRGTELAIIEMGANHVGEIAALCQIALPTHGLITNISGAHLEGFGSYDGVKKAKAELYQFISSKNGIIFYNKKDEVLKSLLKENDKKFGYSHEVSLNAFLKLDMSYPYIHLSYKSISESLKLESNLYGTYNLININAALTIGEFLGLTGFELKKGIEKYTPTNNRSELISWKGKTIILDAYNANPASMKASISHFAEHVQGRKALILGEMAELGDYSLQKHQELLQFIHQWQWEKVILIGEIFKEIRPSDPYCFRNTEDILLQLKGLKLMKSIEHLLLKGSRASKLEKLVPLIKD